MNKAELLELADTLTDQRSEPFPGDPNRVHYWRDKAIKVARSLRALAKDAEG